MRIGVLLTCVAEYGKSGFYNNQEIGLAKELSKLVDELIIYRSVPASAQREDLTIPGCPNTTLKRIPTPSRGINGIWDCSVMDAALDALIYFSDTQLAVPGVYKWCRKHGVKLFPYIGVIESHSTSAAKRLVMDFMFARNTRVYKKNVCFVKTPTVAQALAGKGVRNTVVAPVGLDTSLLRSGYEQADTDALKSKWGYAHGERILLFIGRMTEEKQPLRMIRIFRELNAADSSYRLLMIGKGELLDAVKQAAQGLPVKFIEQVPNSEMWELYRISDAFVNLNQQEIFGMAILEAMYYGCRVVAWKAPGPSFIIGESRYGSLCDSDAEIKESILHNTVDTDAAHERILERFTWASTARLIKNSIT